MSFGILDPNQIEKLFERASEGNVPLEVEQAGGGRRRWLRTVDFTRPSKFSADQERRMRRALDTFCERAMTRLAAEHRLPVELEVIDVQQLTWTNAFALLPEQSVHGAIQTAPHDGRMLVSAELPLMLLALERLMGGSTEERIDDRELTDIDISIVRRLLGTVVDCLSTVWFDLSETTLALGDVETQSELVQVAAGSEPTLALTLEGRLFRVSSTVVLLVPYAAIAPVAGAFSRRDEDSPSRSPQTAAAVQSELGRVDVALRAEIASTTLTLEEVLALQIGDVLRLEGGADGSVTVFADRTPVLQARAGRSGKHRAIQVVAPAEVEP